jgi:CCR4-NOT transcription complex subunit 10
MSGRVLALEKGLLAKSLPKREDVKVMVIGEGKWRRAFLPTRSLNPTVSSAKLGLQVDDDAVEDMELLIPQEDRKWFVAGKLYELSLNFAIQCLRTAICLIDQWEAIPAESVTAAAAEEVKDNDGIKLTDKKGGSSNAAGRPAGEGKDCKGIMAAVAAYENQRGIETAGLKVGALSALAYVN